MVQHKSFCKKDILCKFSDENGEILCMGNCEYYVQFQYGILCPIPVW